MAFTYGTNSLFPQLGFLVICKSKLAIKQSRPSRALKLACEAIEWLFGCKLSTPNSAKLRMARFGVALPGCFFAPGPFASNLFCLAAATALTTTIATTHTSTKPRQIAVPKEPADAQAHWQAVLTEGYVASHLVSLFTVSPPLKKLLTKIHLVFVQTIVASY